MAASCPITLREIGSCGGVGWYPRLRRAFSRTFSRAFSRTFSRKVSPPAAFNYRGPSPSGPSVRRGAIVDLEMPAMDDAALRAYARRRLGGLGRRYYPFGIAAAFLAMLAGFFPSTVSQVAGQRFAAPLAPIARSGYGHGGSGGSSSGAALSGGGATSSVASSGLAGGFGLGSGYGGSGGGYGGSGIASPGSGYGGSGGAVGSGGGGSPAESAQPGVPSPQVLLETLAGLIPSAVKVTPKTLAAVSAAVSALPASMRSALAGDVTVLPQVLSALPPRGIQALRAALEALPTMLEALPSADRHGAPQIAAALTSLAGLPAGLLSVLPQCLSSLPGLLPGFASELGSLGPTIVASLPTVIQALPPNLAAAPRIMAEMADGSSVTIPSADMPLFIGVAGTLFGPQLLACLPSQVAGIFP